MATNILPTVNFNSNPGVDEFEFQHDVYSEEFILRALISGGYGVVDTSDPASTPFDAGRPLIVTVSPVDPLTIDIAPGFLVTPSRMLINVDANISSVPLQNVSAGKIYVVMTEYKLLENTATRMNRFGVPVTTRLFRPSNTPPDGSSSTLSQAITIAELNDYNNTSLFPTERKDGLVVIAIVTVLSDAVTSALTLSIDLTNTVYSFNRPWFSMTDIYHRQQIGAGLVSKANPHGTELQNLSSGGITLYQQLKAKGGILAKDWVYYGYPGTKCSETITLNMVEIDKTGEITGQGGAYYYRASKLPIRTGSLYKSEKPWEPVPYTWVQGTRIIVLGTLEDPRTWTESLVLEYFSVYALEVGPESISQGVQTLTVQAPISGKELIITDGISINTLAQTSLALPSLLGPIKKEYKVACNGRGVLVLDPQPLVASLKVTDITGSNYTVNQTPTGGEAAYLIVGLTKAVERSIIGSTSYDLDLKIQLTGTSSTGAPLIEILNFKASQWKDQSSSLNVEEPLQSLRTKNKFKTLTQITLKNTSSEPHNAGPDALISVWADALGTTVNQGLCSVCSFFWTGTTGVRLKDERVIGTTLMNLDQRLPRLPAALPEGDFSFATELFSTILTPPLTHNPTRRLALELDDDRMWSETWSDFSTADATSQISLINYIFVHPGIKITLGSTGKVLTFVSTSGSASVGKVYIGASETELRNNLIATINDPTFDSTWFSVIEDSGEITCTRPFAEPEGWWLNRRQEITFNDIFQSGNTITITINGTVVTQAFTVDHTTTMNSLITGINSVTSQTQVDAIQYTPGQHIILNGPSHDPNFPMSIIVSIAGPFIDYSIMDPQEAFILTQPSGGRLPLSHLPQRYPTDAQPWSYQSRPMLWEGVQLEGTIGFNSNNPALITDYDQVKIASDKILIARRGTSIINPSRGEFLVDPSSLTATLDAMVHTINEPTFNSGVHGRIKELVLGPDNIILSTDTIAHPGHGFVTDEQIIFTAISGATLPSGIIPGYVYYLVNATPDTFQISIASSGSVQGLGSQGSGAFRASENLVRLVTNGYGNSILMKIVEGVSGTWLIDPYTPVGPGSTGAHALIKTLKPLSQALWRYQTISSGTWSNWTPLSAVSGNCFRLDGPAGESLYSIQLKLQGESGNGFALYQFIPEVAGSTIADLNVRMAALENEILLARGSQPTLGNRLQVGMAADGSLAKDSEIVSSRSSKIQTSASTLYDHLDSMDAQLWTLFQGPDLIGSRPADISGLEAIGQPNQILSGPVDGQGNSEFFSTSGANLYVGGTEANPLVFSLNGYRYAYYREVPLSFASSASGTYFVYAETSSSGKFGSLLVTGTNTTASPVNSNMFYDTSTNFQLASVGSGSVVPGSVLVIGSDWWPIVEVPGANSLKILGIFRATIPSGTTYKIYNRREASILGFTGTWTPPDRTRIYLGEVDYNGAGAFSDVRNYRYLDRFVSGLEEADASGGNYTLEFQHNLGHFPPSFTLYFHTVGSGDQWPKVLNIGDEAVVRVSTSKIQIKNRYGYQVAKTWAGTVQSQGYIQLII